MDFEDKKKEFPGLGETLATGRYFGSVGIEFLEANFQNNSAITQFNSSPDTGLVRQFRVFRLRLRNCSTIKAWL